ncbi:DUF2079 domain-containing protein [Flindersiella endophytica]
MPSAARRGIRITPNRIGVGLITLVSAVAYSLLGLVNLRNFRASTFDLVIFDQAVRGYAHFGAPTTPARGAFLGQGPDFLQLADHFSPILAVLAPLYWIHDSPSTLIVAQSVLFALAIPPLWIYTQRKLGTAPAYLVVIMYATSAAVAQAAGFDFHEVAFVPVLTAVLVERFDAGKPLAGSLAGFGLLLVKEDLGLLIIGFGCYLLLTRRFRYGVGFVLGGIVAIGVTRGVLIPAFGGDPATFWAYNHLGRNVPEVLHTMVTDPGRVLSNLVTPQEKLDTMLGMVKPLLFLCLLSPLILPALPMILERMLSDRPYWWAADFQYDAFVIVILICAAVDAVARIQRWWDRRREPRRALRPIAFGWAAIVCVISLFLVKDNYLGKLFSPDFYRGGPEVAAAREAADHVPDGVTVDAYNTVGPALTGRTTVLLWEPKFHDVPWVVANTERIHYPWNSVEDQAKRVPELVAMGYRIVYENEGFVVLHRPTGQ